MIRAPGICVGYDHGDGRCIECTLPMANHPIEFVYPDSPKASPLIRRAYERHQAELKEKACSS